MSGQSGSERRRMPFEILVRMDWVLYQRLSTEAANTEGGQVTLAGCMRNLINRHAAELPDLDVPAYLPVSQPRERPKPLGSDVQALQTIPPAAGKVAGLTRHLASGLRARGETAAADAMTDARAVLGTISLWAVARIELRIEKACLPVDEETIRRMAEGLLDSGRRLKASFGDGAVIDEAKTDGIRRYAERLTRLFESLKSAERGDDDDRENRNQRFEREILRSSRERRRQRGGLLVHPTWNCRRSSPRCASDLAGDGRRAADQALQHQPRAQL